MGSMPPLPEKFREAPNNEEVDSESELPLAQSPTLDAPEVSDGQNRKRSQSESSDSSPPPSPRGPSFLDQHGEDEGASSAPIPAMPIRAMAPQQPGKKKKKEKVVPVFNF